MTKSSISITSTPRLSLVKGTIPTHMESREKLNAQDTSIVNPDKVESLLSIDELTNLMNEEIKDDEKTEHKSLHHKRAIGDYLIRIKKLVPDRGWGSWLNDNFPYCDRTARNYIFLAKKWDKLLQIVESDSTLEFSKLNYKKALELLTNKESSEDLVDAAPFYGWKKLFFKSQKSLDDIIERYSNKPSKSRLLNRVKEISNHYQWVEKEIDEIDREIKDLRDKSK